MKKKILSLCLVIALAATAVIGGTLAYFTDTDKDVNVMTSGNVKIVQNETDRDGNAWNADSTNNEGTMPLLPAVYLENGKPYNPTTTWEGPKGGTEGGFTGPDGKPMDMYASSLNNEIDKVVSVTNTGSLPAYIRTFVLIENDKDETGKKLFDNNSIHYVYNNDENIAFKSFYSETDLDIDGDGVAEPYVLLRFVYKNTLAAGATSAPSLKQFWLDPSVDNDWYDLLDENGLTVVAFSQAVQAAGFEDLGADAALEAAFGPFTEENVATWLTEANVVKTSFGNNVVGGALDTQTQG